MRVRLHFSKDPRQRGKQGVETAEESIVGSVLAGVLPQPFGRIQFRRVGRQLMDFQPMPVGLEPGPDLGILMVGGVVLNQNRSLAAIPPSELFEKAEIGGGIENSVLTIIEPRAPKFDGTKNLHVLALSGHGDFRRVPYAAPGGVERRVLPEAGFVGEDERPMARVGFFLRAG